VTGAIVHYRAALVAWRGSGVRRRLAQTRPGPVGHPVEFAAFRVASRRAARRAQAPSNWRVGSIAPFHARVRRLAARTGLTVRTWVIHALTHATVARGTRLREID
jgi:hypothetical protein